MADSAECAPSYGSECVIGGEPGSLASPSHPATLIIDEWLVDFDVFVRQCVVPEEERSSGGVDGLPWRMFDAGGVVSPGGGSPGLQGPGVSDAATVWAVVVAARRVLCADAVGG